MVKWFQVLLWDTNHLIVRKQVCNVELLNNYIQPIDGTLSDTTTTPGCSEHQSDSNEGLLQIP